jgi:membrane associated rhomboid family serine protease
MSWRDRPYSDGGYEQPQMRLQLRKPSTAVMWLIVANVVIHVINAISTNFISGGLTRIGGLSLEGLLSLHFWQPVTYMFLHDVVDMPVAHLLMNMLGLYIFGTEFENHFGRERFLQFYGLCGIVGGLVYVLLGVIWPQYWGNIPIVGASGAVYGLLMAAIIFFPHIQIILIIFPMPVRVFGLIIAFTLLIGLLTGRMDNVGGQVCHVAGAATGIAIFWAWGLLPKVQIGSGRLGQFVEKKRQGSWARKQKQLAEEQVEVDRILAKVHDQGIQSLSRKERKLLERATRRQQEQDRKLGRTDRL